MLSVSAPVKVIPSVAAYRDAFAQECAHDYPMVTAFEQRTGFAVDRNRLEAAAAVLACPVKVHPPNWQHGRILYARTRALLAHRPGPVDLLDIGTAKGFSALCLEWALRDSGRPGQVTSVDVIDPASHARRNTVAECDGLKTLAEILKPWPEAQTIQFLHATGIDYLSYGRQRIDVAFIDGKHRDEIVREEGHLLAARQQAGDLAIFDDVQIPGVAAAVRSLADVYTCDILKVHPDRAYAIGVRR
jgi:predicted O-methyltransferase YrrM